MHFTTRLYNRRDGVVIKSIRFAVGRPWVRFLSRVISKDFKKWYSQLSWLALRIKKEIVSRTNRQVCLLCPWARHLTGRLHLYVAGRWRTRTLPDYNSKSVHPTFCNRRLFNTHQWQSALLVVGLPAVRDRFEMGCQLFLCLISIRLNA